MTDNQKKFMDDAKEQGFELKQYSGRHMFGEYCPAVYVDSPGDFSTKAVTEWDQLGLGFVIYCPN